MKKLSLLLAIIFIVSSCEGDRGPQGPPGLDGAPGDAIIGTIFEIEIDFLAQNNFSFIFEFPPNEVEVFESDIVKVYMLEETVSDPSGPVDVWTPLPNSFSFNDGNQLVYNYNHTFFDVNIFLDGNIDLNTVSNDFLTDQVFRIAIIPADFAESNENLNSYESVMEAMPNAKVLKVQ